MIKTKSKFTIYFEDPFWVGVLEEIDGKKMRVAKLTFGKEPLDADVFRFMCDSYRALRFSDPVDAVETEETRPNPKRVQREISKALNENGVGTKAQNALKAQYEKNKAENKQIRREEEKELEERKFELKQEKKLEKHKGH